MGNVYVEGLPAYESNANHGDVSTRARWYFQQVPDRDIAVFSGKLGMAVSDGRTMCYVSMVVNGVKVVASNSAEVVQEIVHFLKQAGFRVDEQNIVSSYLGVDVILTAMRP